MQVDQDGTWPTLRDSDEQPYVNPNFLAELALTLGISSGVYVQESDPGAVGAGAFWLTSAGLNVRNVTNDGWLDVVHVLRP